MPCSLNYVVFTQMIDEAERSAVDEPTQLIEDEPGNILHEVD